ncbi:NERD domain-containing protein [Piscibacillus sp. B03]|uniref:NERD domain-containing protein n=1 Tax=Piscibacillus sp. B03 TaxID=3457430 RepID=UPI003FCD6CE0
MKDQPTSVKLLKLLAINRQIIPGHKVLTVLEEQIARYSSGYYGEVSIDYHLKYILENLPKLSNIRLKLNGIYFEIDTILFCEKFILLLQVKNVVGRISVDHHVGQMVQNYKGELTSYQDPILQVEKHARLLSNWLRQKGITVPIETLVVFTNKNAIIEHDHQQLDQRVISGYKLSHAYYQLENMYKNQPSITNRMQIFQELQRNNQIYDMNLLEELELSENDLAPGAVCPNCFRKRMIYYRSNFTCEYCHTQNTNTLQEVLKDYYLIFGSEISSDTLSQWLNVDSTTASRLLKNQGFQSKGGKRYRSYLLEYDYRTDFEYLLSYNKKLYLNKIR